MRFLPLTPGRFADLEALFGPNGACGGCWCMYWRLPAKAFAASKGMRNRRSFSRVAASGSEPGILAYDGAEPVGWCAVAPRAEYARLERSRVLAPVDDAPVWSISCLFVRRDRRRRGLSRALIDAGVAHARRRGARIVEGYPIDRDRSRGRTADAFAWTGLLSAFLAAGFEEVARRSPTRPIVRRLLRGRAAPAAPGSGA